jgi:catechol 2,3-dioxygenase-like lactoylglutathione lyase family enzyme
MNVSSSDNWLIDHTSISVRDINRSVEFYQALLAPLRITILMRIDRHFAVTDDTATDLGGVAFGIDYPVFWIDVFHRPDGYQHIAFRATDREQVIRSYQAGLAAGGSDNGGPGDRGGPDGPVGYPPGYYAAFLLDPDGNNIEVLCRES